MTVLSRGGKGHGDDTGVAIDGFFGAGAAGDDFFGNNAATDDFLAIQWCQIEYI
jgi:hypothetical protein